MRYRTLALHAFAALALASPLAARDCLGVFGEWGAFRDPETPRCYAIAMANASRARQDTQPFASIGTWPGEQVRGQVHFRLSRQARPGAAVRLFVGAQAFTLQGAGADAWAADRQADAAILAAMRSASAMRISASDRVGNRFTDRYSLAGAATAMDAASVGCAAR